MSVYANDELTNHKIRWSSREQEQLTIECARLLPYDFRPRDILAAVKQAQRHLEQSTSVWKGRVRQITTLQMVPWLEAEIRKLHTAKQSEEQMRQLEEQSKKEGTAKKEILDSLSMDEILGLLCTRITAQVKADLVPEIKAFVTHQIAVQTAANSGLHIEKEEKIKVPIIALAGFMSQQCQTMVQAARSKHGKSLEVICINKDVLPSQQADKAQGTDLVIIFEGLHGGVRSAIQKRAKNTRLATGVATALALIDQFANGELNGITR